jgi:DNA-binding NarL/FixJ family response regulator
MERDELEERRRVRRARTARGRPIQVVVVDPYPIERYGLTLILQTQADIEVIAQADGTDEALVLAARLREEPGVVFLVSVELTGRREAERCVQGVRRQAAAIPVILYNADAERTRAGSGRLPVDAVLRKGVHPADVLDALRRSVRAAGASSAEIVAGRFRADPGRGAGSETDPKRS